MTFDNGISLIHNMKETPAAAVWLSRIIVLVELYT